MTMDKDPPNPVKDDAPAHIDDIRAIAGRLAADKPIERREGRVKAWLRDPDNYSFVIELLASGRSFNGIAALLTQAGLTNEQGGAVSGKLLRRRLNDLGYRAAEKQSARPTERPDGLTDGRGTAAGTEATAVTASPAAAPKPHPSGSAKAGAARSAREIDKPRPSRKRMYTEDELFSEAEAK